MKLISEMHVHPQSQRQGINFDMIDLIAADYLSIKLKAFTLLPNHCQLMHSSSHSQRSVSKSHPMIFETDIFLL